MLTTTKPLSFNSTLAFSSPIPSVTGFLPNDTNKLSPIISFTLPLCSITTIILSLCFLTSIIFAFKSRTTTNKLDTICYYNNKFKEFPPRSGLEYEKVIGNNSHMGVYTTTIKNPIHIQFAISRKPRSKSPACIKIECLSPIDKLLGALVANFNIILLDNTNNIMSTKNQIWTFHNYFKLKFTDFENRFTNFKIQFCKIYFIENKKVTDIIANTEAIKKID